MVSKFFKYSLIWYTLRAFEFKQKKRAYKVYKYNVKHVIYYINVKVVQKRVGGFI